MGRVAQCAMLGESHTLAELQSSGQVHVLEEVVELEEVEEDFVVWEIGKFATCEIEDFGRFWRSFCG